MSKTKTEANKLFSVNETIMVHPYEGAYLFSKFLRGSGIKFKPVSRTEQTMFGPIEIVPETMSFEVAPNVIDSFVWGELDIDNIDGNLKTGYEFKDERPVFAIKGTLNQIHRRWVEDIAKQFRAYCSEKSLYRNKAFTLRAEKTGKVAWNSPPTFIDTTLIKDNEFILDQDLINQINHTLFIPVKNSVECRAAGIPLKRGVLLEGPYGTGKTLTARATAKLCVDNGWTFILVDHPKAFAEAFVLAETYSPAVIFAEDMDLAAKGEDRTTEVNLILNTIDGIKSKNAEVIMVMTTNHADTINKALLRPGRIDSIVSFKTPSIGTISRLISKYAGSFLPVSEDIESVSEILLGNTPAVIREVVERTKLKLISDNTSTMTAEDLRATVVCMKNHIELINTAIRAPDQDPVSDHPNYKLGEAFANVVKKCGISTNGTVSASLLDYIGSHY